MQTGGPGGIYIREMTTADIKEAAALEKACFSEPWSEKGFADALSMAQALFIAAESPGGGIAGCCGIYIAGDEGEITNVAVAEPERRRGVGDAMLERLIATAGERGVSRIFLEVRASNEPAIRLYEKHGFVLCGLRRNFYRFPAEDALCFCLDGEAAERN